MNRSVRNGLAIAGMAGGIFFLGQAVASADDGGQTGSADNTVSQTSTGSGDSTNVNFSEAEATNVQTTEVDVDIDAGDGGENNLAVNTGVIAGYPADSVPVATTLSTPPGPPPARPATTITVNTGDVNVTQNANGGDVNHSGNVNVENSGSQTATATNTVTQTATSTEDHNRPPHHDGDYNKPSSLQGGNPHGSDATNVNLSSAEATNIDKTEVDVDIDAGDGGTNNAEINTGIIGNTFYCPPYSTCTFNLTTGSVYVTQNANGGSVNGSGNVNIGDTRPAAHHHDGVRPGHHDGVRPGHHEADCPKHENASPAVKPAAAKPVAAKPAASAPVAHKAPAVSSAQPSGQLAFTGSDVSLPLTVGLIALGLGVGLTALGRRRETQTV
jgi:hypothetical protein